MLKGILKFWLILVIMVFLLFFLSIAYISNSPTEELTPQELFTYHIARPIPASVSNLECTYYFDPTLGDGAFEIRFEIVAKDLKRILSGVDKYEYTLESPPEFDSSKSDKVLMEFLGKDVIRFTYDYDDRSTIIIYTNKKMTKVIARHDGFINNNPIAPEELLNINIPQ